jgi:streptogramin lyase
MRPISLLKLMAAALAAAALLPAVAGAAPAVNGVFDLSGQPRHLTLSPDGNVWVALDGVTYDVAQVRPDGTVTGFQTADITSPNGIAAGPDGNLWVTQSGGVVRFSAADPTRTTLFPIADITDPRAIVAGPDGNLWTGSGDRRSRSEPTAAQEPSRSRAWPREGSRPGATDGSTSPTSPADAWSR